MEYEYGVLLVSCTPSILGLYNKTDDKELRHTALILGVLALVTGVLEKIKLPVALSRNGSPGLFYGYVVVAAVLLQCSMNQEMHAKQFMAMSMELTHFSIWMILFSLTSWLFKCSSATINSYIRDFALVTIIGYFMHAALNLPINLTLFLRVVSCLVVIKITSYYLPNCFTLGEMLLLYNLLTTFLLNVTYFESNFEITVIATWVLFFVMLFLMSLIPICLVGIMSTWYFYSSGFLLLACLLIVLSESIVPNAIHWTIDFLWANWPHRQLLLISWLIEIFITVLYVTFWRDHNGKSSTSERKIFHIIILLTYIPGIWYDIPLLLLCSVGSVCILLILETMRVLKIPPLEKVLNDSLSVFIDAQDSGCLILTPVYLLLGQSLPIWISCLQDPSLLTNPNSKVPIAAYSGILSVGLGDTAASVIGSNFGRHRWMGTNKTVEGTFAAFFAQSAFVIFLSETNSLIYVFIAILSVSLIEAFTCQIDNLILPSYMFFLLNVQSS
ncbi:dolichol kinase-like [Styela clava]